MKFSIIFTKKLAS